MNLRFNGLATFMSFCSRNPRLQNHSKIEISQLRFTAPLSPKCEALVCGILLSGPCLLGLRLNGPPEGVVLPRLRNDHLVLRHPAPARGWVERVLGRFRDFRAWARHFRRVQLCQFWRPRPRGAVSNKVQKPWEALGRCFDCVPSHFDLVCFGGTGLAGGCSSLKTRAWGLGSVLLLCSDGSHQSTNKGLGTVSLGY